MIEARQFVERARVRGFRFYAGVPCSYLTPLINYVLADRELAYVSSANEGDAVATAAGAALCGQRSVAMMQNSGLGNAVSPLASLTWVFRIPLLLIVTWRGDPEVPDEPQHRLMGAITGTVLDALEIPWELMPADPSGVEAALARATSHMVAEQRPYALLARKGTVAPHPLGEARFRGRAPGAEGYGSRYRGLQGERPSRRQALERILAGTHDPGTVVIATTGYTGRELYALQDRPNHLYMVGSMGCASSLGLGIALARRDLRVVIIDGDGAALMRMGNLATLGVYGGSNLVHIVLDNEAHESTGGQDTVSSAISFARIASACGYGVALEGDDLALLDGVLDAGEAPGPRFAQLKIRPGTGQALPRPDLSPEQIRVRFMDHIREVASGREPRS